MGLVNDIPLIEKVWLAAIPTIAQKKRMPKSFLPIPILTGFKKYMPQNSKADTEVLMTVKAIG